MEPVYLAVRIVVVFLLRLTYRFKAFGTEHVPATGPVIIAPNHISNFDPLCVAYLVDHMIGRKVRFLAKASLWKRWYTRFIFERSKQIPVERGSGDAGPTVAAQAALARGECVIVYPEGTITTNADLTPMEGKTGVARLALATGAPVFPVAVWGAQWMLGKGRVWRYRGHRDVYFSVGEPMTFPEFAGATDDRAVLREVTARIVDRISDLLTDLQAIHPDRGAVPPMKEPRA